MLSARAPVGSGISFALTMSASLRASREPRGGGEVGLGTDDRELALSPPAHEVGLAHRTLRAPGERP
jgi:hypothetical protein